MNTACTVTEPSSADQLLRSTSHIAAKSGQSEFSSDLIVSATLIETLADEPRHYLIFPAVLAYLSSESTATLSAALTVANRRKHENEHAYLHQWEVIRQG